MLIATCSVGDSLVTLAKATPVTPSRAEQEEKAWYALTFTDLPTGEVYTHVFTGENDALLAFAAWIAADEPAGFPELERLRKELQDSPAHKLHMP